MTFTVLALDETRTAIGVATASRSLAVGATVPAIDADLGAVASQAWTNPALRSALLDRLGKGDSPDEAIAQLPQWDFDPEHRQAAVLDFKGRTAVHTGAMTSGWRGHIAQDGLIVLGNLLTGREVLEAMVDAFDSPAGPDALARSLVGSLQAGQEAGGDARGRQSAAVLVAERGRVLPHYDLRVDDHNDPVAKLAELVKLRAASPTVQPASTFER